MGKHDDLLRRFQPMLRYDSNEQFFADSAAQYTDAPGIELRRVPHNGKPGALIASAVPVGQRAEAVARVPRPADLRQRRPRSRRPTSSACAAGTTARST